MIGFYFYHINTGSQLHIFSSLMFEIKRFDTQTGAFNGWF